MIAIVPLVALLAQAAPPGPGGPRAGRPAFEEAAKMVDAYIVSNLQESLGLSDEQFVKLLPVVKRLQSDRREYVTGRMRTVREMRRLLESGGSSEAQVLEKLREVKRSETEGQDKVRKDQEAVDAALTPLQQAKFRVLEADVERRIREVIGQARRQGREGPRGSQGEGGPPPNPDER